MSTTYLQPGEDLTLVAPTGGVTDGVPLLIGGLLVIPHITATAGSTFTAKAVGVHAYTKTASQAWVQGEAIHWDVANAKFTNDTTLGPRVGVAVEAVAGGAGDTTGKVRLDGVTVTWPAVTEGPAATSITTGGNVTITAAQLLTGSIIRDCAGGARTDTLPTAALLVAAIAGAKVGDIVRCYIVNGSDAAETLTVDAGAGGAYPAAQTAASRIVGQNTSKLLHIRLTNVTALSEAYVCWM